MINLGSYLKHEFGLDSYLAQKEISVQKWFWVFMNLKRNTLSLRGPAGLLQGFLVLPILLFECTFREDPATMEPACN